MIPVADMMAEFSTTLLRRKEPRQPGAPLVVRDGVVVDHVASPLTWVIRLVAQSMLWLGQDWR